MNVNISSSENTSSPVILLLVPLAVIVKIQYQSGILGYRRISSKFDQTSH